ncbi:hypothetical protein Q31b_39960 [Novipirellula aureliae]|uniref:Uncharacterized protein n=2 Tax=Novipirellula aureliae TaxID=2527966 RepID=A0A5C6DQ89_9BACT|nr:hypothetical protein Q31b_39960 [Novipirellula aureliae]
MAELLIAATLVMTGMAMVTPLAMRSGRMWMQTREHHLALDELANQLERLTHLPAAELPGEIENLTASDWVLQRLPAVKLDAEILDQNAIRISIDWKRTGDPAPLQLVGWPKNADAEPSE